MKLVAIKVVGSDQEPLIVELGPDMTAGEILEAADLADWALFRKSNPMKYIAAEEELYELLTDCETLYAVFPTGD